MMKNLKIIFSLAAAFLLSLDAAQAALPEHLSEETLAPLRAAYNPQVQGQSHVHGYPVGATMLNLTWSHFGQREPDQVKPYQPFHWDDPSNWSLEENRAPMQWPDAERPPVTYWKDGAFYIHLGRVQLNGRTFDKLPHKGWKEILAGKLQTELSALIDDVVIDGSAVPVLKKAMGYDADNVALYTEIIQPAIERVTQEYEQARTVLAMVAYEANIVRMADMALPEDYPAVFSALAAPVVDGGSGSSSAPADE